MVNIRVDNQGSLEVHFPSPVKRSDVSDLGKKHLPYEQTLPTKQQNIFTPIISNLMQQIIELEKKGAAGEAQRAVAADAVPGLERRSKRLIESMMKTIDVAFPHRPAKAKEWGFNTKKGTANILTPKNQKERLAVMESYIAKEESRPEEERFTMPALADVIDNYQSYNATIKNRNVGQYQRQKYVNASNALAKQLGQYLQLAAGVIVGYDYKLEISRDLQHWGYKVIKRRSSKKAETNDDAPANGSTNGSADDSGLTDTVSDITDQSA